VTDDLAFPAFLVGVRKKSGPPRARKWARMLPVRPEGAKWEAAERWQVNVPVRWSDIGKESRGVGSGTRLLWVIEGRTWTELRDTEGYVKVPTVDWQKAAKNGRKVS
jgi:hypothetical protein